MKTLILDIETSYNIVPTFSLWPKFISHDNIIQDWYIICAAWKWSGQKRVHGAYTYDTNDYGVVKKLREAVIEADEIVYHNGDRFDFKKLNTRVILNGLNPMPKPKSIDTLKQAKKHFAFTSNRLDYIGRVLCDDKKLDTGKNLWFRVLQGEKKAVDEMYKYNKQDVLLLEKVWDKLRVHIDYGVNPNINELLGDKCTNIQCGSSNLQSRGYRYTIAHKYRRYQCQDCHKWCSSSTPEKRHNKVVR